MTKLIYYSHPLDIIAILNTIGSFDMLIEYTNNDCII